MSQNFTVVPPSGKGTRSTPLAGKTLPIVIGVCVLLVIVLLTIFSPLVTIPTGHTGVLTTFGRVSDVTLEEGFHLKNPIQEVILMDTRTQKAQIQLGAFSSDIQQVDVICSVNFAIDRASAQNLYKRVGRNYFATVMEPRILENVKAVFTRYNAEKLMEVRHELSTQVLNLLAPEMAVYGINIVSISIENVDFTDAFTDAVESKQVAEQTKLKVETEQAQQVSMERSAAERQVISANAQAQERSILAEANASVQRINADAAAYARKVESEAEAEANQKIAASVTQELIDYRQIDRWDGKLPMFGSASANNPLPVINVPAGGLESAS